MCIAAVAVFSLMMLRLRNWKKGKEQILSSFKQTNSKDAKHTKKNKIYQNHAGSIAQPEVEPLLMCLFSVPT